METYRNVLTRCSVLKKMALRVNPSGFFRLHWFSLCSLFLGFSLVALFVNTQIKTDKDLVDKSFKFSAKANISTVKSTLNNAVNDAFMLANVIKIQHPLTRESFHAYTAPLLELSPEVQALEWVPRIIGTQRLAVEKSAQHVYPGFAFKERDENHQLVVESIRPEYFPVYYVEPYVGNEQALGFDINSESIRSEALHRALTDGTPTASGWVTLVREKGMQPGLLIFAPLFSSNNFNKTTFAQPNQLIGLTMSVIGIGDLVTSALKGHSELGVNLLLEDVTPGAPKSQPYLYTPSAVSGDTNQRIHSVDQNSTVYVENIAIGGRLWQVTATPAAGCFTYMSGYRLWTTPILLMLLSIVIAIYIEFSTQQNTLLADSKKRLDCALKSAGMGIWSLDIANDIRHFDAAACHLFGINPKTFSGTPDEFFSILNTDDLARVRLALERTINKGMPYNVEYLVHWPDGTAHVLESIGRLQRNLHGEPGSINGVVYDISERKSQENELSNLVFNDALTDIPNRRFFIERLKHAQATSARNGFNCALLVIDLDDFKEVNDSFGHVFGDQLLIEMSARVKSCIREADTVARIGGDEFVVLLENLRLPLSECANMVMVIANKIKNELAVTYLINNNEYRGSASIGALLFSGHENSIDELLSHADAAMYKSKKLGGDSVHFFDSAMDIALTRRAELESNLRSSFEKNQLEVYYQPQVTDKNVLVGVEALLRWNHPVHGNISPKEFIPLAEATGLIHPIGQFVLETVCKQLLIWEKNDATSRLFVALNVSAKRFIHHDFVKNVINTIDNFSVNPKKIILELTETALLQNVESSIEKMNFLKHAGISFSLDNFGKGYLSLDLFTNFPISQIKIDQVFIDNSLSNSLNESLIRFIIDLGRTLKIPVMAKGVETAAQKDLLLSMGCNAYQGYLYSKALSAAQLEDWMANLHQQSYSKNGQI